VITVLFAITFTRRSSLTQTVGIISKQDDESALTTAELVGVDDSIVTALKTGCNNWHSSSLEAEVVSDENECVNKCRSTGGCVAANYQIIDCPHLPHISHAHRACYLMNEDCIEGPNECWNVYKLAVDEREIALFGKMVTRGAGCKNIADISKGIPSSMFSKFTCHQKCEHDEDCVGIIMKAPGCAGNDDDKGQVCQLIYGLCEEDKSEQYACWDIEYKAVHEDVNADLKFMFHTVEDASVDDNTLVVTNTSCFRVGDVLELFHEEEDFKHQYTLEKVDTTQDKIKVSPAFTHGYAKGTGVLRIHYPYSASHCGDFDHPTYES
jgi:hypothetical protein